MNRLSAAFFAAFAIAILITGIALAAPTLPTSAPDGPIDFQSLRPDVPAGAGDSPASADPATDAVSAGDSLVESPSALRAGPNSPAASRLDFWISDSENGEPVEAVMSTTHRVWAVADFEDANRENYVVQMRDLAGIVVVRKGLLLDGSGRASVSIGVTDFIQSYAGAMDTDLRDRDGNCVSPACAIAEAMDEMVLNCESVPPVPPNWPDPPIQPTAQPGQPTPTPGTDPFRLWFDRQVSLIGSAQSATAELTRTVQSMMGMPDIRESPTLGQQLQLAQAELIATYNSLEEAKNEINPPRQNAGSGTPTPVPELPDPDAGCAALERAKAQLESALGRIGQILAEADANKADWRLPSTGSRWQGDMFIGCVRYLAELFAIVGNRQQAQPTATAEWSVGEPGAPRLIFPSPDLLEQSTQGELNLVPADGSRALYAQGVTVPGVNHSAHVAAYVTDDQCIPVSGYTMTFGVNPLDAGTVTEQVVDIVGGHAATTLNAGNQPYDSALVTGFVQLVPKRPDGPPAGIVGDASFAVIGPAYGIQFLMDRNRTINTVGNQRLNFSVEVNDQLRRNVADGTRVRVSVPEGDPAVIAYERRMQSAPRPGQPTPTPEVVVVGKEIEMLTEGGLTQLEPSGEPGIVHRGPFLTCTGLGKVTLAAEADGASANTNDPDSGLKTISCVRRYRIALPKLFMKFDIHATTTPLPIETSTPTPGI